MKQSIQNNTGEDECQECGNKPAILLHQTITKGIIVGFSQNDIKVVVCDIHANEIYRYCQKETLIKGWWFLFGWFYVPVAWLSNRSLYKKYTKILKNKTTN